MQELELTKTQLLTLLNIQGEEDVKISIDPTGRIWVPSGSYFQVIDKDGSSREVDLT